MLVGNVKRLHDYDTALAWQKACRVWRNRFEEYIDAAQREIDRFKRDELPEDLRKVWQQMLREGSWILTVEFSSIPLQQLEEERVQYRYRGRSADEIKPLLFAAFIKDVAKWDRGIRAKARDAWKKLETAATAINESLKTRSIEGLEVPREEAMTIAGFHVTLVGYSRRGYKHDESIAVLKAGLERYVKRAQAVYPWLLRYRLPLRFDFNCEMDRGGSYEPGAKTIQLCAGPNRKPDAVVKTLAHEMGHHVYREVLSRSDHEFWAAAIRGGLGPLDLREVLKRSSAEFVVLDDRLIETEPLYALRLETLLHDIAYKNLGLETRSGIEEYLAKGGEPVLQVTLEPITGYAAKNSEEAFCEAFGLAVAYGPRTLLPAVRQRLQMLMPQLRIQANYKVTAAFSAWMRPGESHRISLTAKGLLRRTNMDQKTTREVVTTLLRSGRRDLAEVVAQQGAKTKQFVNNIKNLLASHDIKMRDDYYIADNRMFMKFEGTFGKKAQAADPKRFGGLAGKTFRLDVTVRAGSQVWVTLTLFRDKVSQSFGVPGRDLDSVFKMVEKGTNDMLSRHLR